MNIDQIGNPGSEDERAPESEYFMPRLYRDAMRTQQLNCSERM